MGMVIFIMDFGWMGLDMGQDFTGLWMEDIILEHGLGV